MAERTAEHVASARRLLETAPEQAITALNRGLFLSPTDVSLYELRAEAYAKLRDIESAIQDLRYVVARQATASVRHRLASLVALQGGLQRDERRALECFAEAADLAPLRAEYWIRVAVAKTKLEDLSGALEAASRALHIEAPKGERGAELLVLRAKLHWALGLTQAGIADMNRAETVFSTHVEVVNFKEAMLRTSADLFQTASRRMRDEDFAGAVAALTTALRLAPDDVKLYITRAAAYRLKGDLDPALDDLRDAAFLCATATAQDRPPSKPSDLPRRMSCGERPMQHRAVYFEPFQLVRQRNLVLNDLALQSLTSGDYDHALSLLNRVIAAEEALVTRKDAETVDRRFFVNRGDCYQALGRIDAATADFRAAFDSDPSDLTVRTRLSVAHYNMATALFNEGHFADAALEFSTAISLNDKVAHFFAGRAQAHYQLSNFDEARRDFKEALRLDPTLDDARAHLKQFAGDLDDNRHDDEPVTSPLKDPDETCRANKYNAVPRGFRVVIRDSKRSFPKLSVASSTSSQQHRKRTNAAYERAQGKVGAIRALAPNTKQQNLWSVLQARNFDRLQR